MRDNYWFFTEHYLNFTRVEARVEKPASRTKRRNTIIMEDEREVVLYRGTNGRGKRNEKKCRLFGAGINVTGIADDFVEMHKQMGVEPKVRQREWNEKMFLPRDFRPPL